MKNTYRFFLPPGLLNADQVSVADAAFAHQLARVLRLGPGDQVVLLDGQNICRVALTALQRDLVVAEVLERMPLVVPAFELTLYVALVRPERFEWVLQKGTELAVQRFVPVQFARSLPSDRTDERKAERWRRIIREAAEQSGRTTLPELAATCSFTCACAAVAATEMPLILWEGTAPPLRNLLRRVNLPPQTIAILSGPEGGITPAELTVATQHGIMPAALGNQILRAETAPIAAAAAICYEFG